MPALRPPPRAFSSPSSTASHPARNCSNIRLLDLFEHQAGPPYKARSKTRSFSNNAEGRHAQAVTLDGTTGYLTMADSSDIIRTDRSQWTVTVWFKVGALYISVPAEPILRGPSRPSANLRRFGKLFRSRQVFRKSLPENRR